MSEAFEAFLRTVDDEITRALIGRLPLGLNTRIIATDRWEGTLAQIIADGEARGLRLRGLAVAPDVMSRLDTVVTAMAAPPIGALGSRLCGLPVYANSMLPTGHVMPLWEEPNTIRWGRW